MSSEPDPARPLWGPARRVTEPVPPPAEDRPTPAPAPADDRAVPDPFAEVAPTPPAWLPDAPSFPPPQFQPQSFSPQQFQPQPPPFQPPPFQPPPVPPPAAPGPTRDGRTGPAVLIGVVVVGVLVIGGIGWSASRTSTGTNTGTDTAVATSTVPLPTPTTDPPAPTTAPSIASPDGMVVVAPDAAGSPYAQAVVALLDRHFTAINNRDFATWSDTVDARRAAAQSSDAWAGAYRSTQDRTVEVGSITSAGPDQLLVTLSFVSTQATSDAPPDLPVAQICWQSAWPITDVSSGGRIAAPSKGTTTKSAC